MKNTIIEIKQLAALLFDNINYNKFCNYINLSQINNARLLIDDFFVEYEDQPNEYHFQLNIADKLSDLVIDLIVNEIDGERREKQVESIIGK